jgi:hypothetical protein
MILILASIVDAAAAAFAEEFAVSANVSLMTCRDLAASRIALRHPNFAASTLTIGGREISVREITGIINLLPAVFPEELVFYPPWEQEYQAAEFHALLTFLLSNIDRPVINRPAAGSLAGPIVNPVAWYHLAWRAGIRVSSISIDTTDFINPFAASLVSATAFEVSCLGGSILSPSETAADHDTLALSRLANVEYLRAVYEKAANGNPELVMIRTVPDLSSDATRRALIDFFARQPERA